MRIIRTINDLKQAVYELFENKINNDLAVKVTDFNSLYFLYLNGTTCSYVYDIMNYLHSKYHITASPFFLLIHQISVPLSIIHSPISIFKRADNRTLYFTNFLLFFVKLFFFI